MQRATSSFQTALSAITRIAQNVKTDSSFKITLVSIAQPIVSKDVTHATLHSVFLAILTTI